MGVNEPKTATNKRRSNKRPASRTRRVGGITSSVGELLKRLRAEGVDSLTAQTQEPDTASPSLASNTPPVGAADSAATAGTTAATAVLQVEAEQTHAPQSPVPTAPAACAARTELEEYQEEQRQQAQATLELQAKAAEEYARACRAAQCLARPYLRAWAAVAPTPTHSTTRQPSECDPVASSNSHSSSNSHNSNSSSDNFFKGVKFSPDGLCLLTASHDCQLRVLEIPAAGVSNGVEVVDAETATIDHDPAMTDDPGSIIQDMSTALWYSECETVYDYCWFPRMHSSYPASCCFLSTARDQPIHLWDAYSGELRASYVAKDAQDDLASAVSVAFNPSGAFLYAGFERCIKVFDISRPGTTCVENRPTCQTRRSDVGQRGLISCLSFNPDLSGLFAAGSYARSVVLYVENDPKAVVAALPHGEHVGGVTQVQFSRDGRYLFSGARMDDHILCWDVRNTRTVLQRFHRPARTNQRVGFDLDAGGRHLVTGTSESHALVYDTLTGELVRRMEDKHVLQDAVNGASFCPTDPGVIALATGQRSFVGGFGGDDGSSDTDDDDDDNDDVVDGSAAAPPRNCVSVWRGKVSFEHQHSSGV